MRRFCGGEVAEGHTVVLTQRGGSCPRSFPFVLGAKGTCTWEAPAPGSPTRQPRWGALAAGPAAVSANSRSDAPFDL
jgi:hypothetical protein